MKNLKSLDEFQLLKRGNVFMHAWFSLIGLLMLNSLLFFCGIEWATGKWAELTIILFTVVLCDIELICRDVFPLTEKRQKVLVYIQGIFGLVSIILCGYELIITKAEVIANGKITTSALGVVYGIMFIAVFVIYEIKKRYNAKHEDDE